MRSSIDCATRSSTTKPCISWRNSRQTNALWRTSMFMRMSLPTWQADMLSLVRRKRRSYTSETLWNTDRSTLTRLGPKNSTPYATSQASRNWKANWRGSASSGRARRSILHTRRISAKMRRSQDCQSSGRKSSTTSPTLTVFQK